MSAEVGLEGLRGQRTTEPRSHCMTRRLAMPVLLRVHCHIYCRRGGLMKQRNGQMKERRVTRGQHNG